MNQNKYIFITWKDVSFNPRKYDLIKIPAQMERSLNHANLQSQLSYQTDIEPYVLRSNTPFALWEGKMKSGILALMVFRVQTGSIKLAY